MNFENQMGTIQPFEGGNQLIETKQSNTGEIIVSARELYDFLEVSERFSKWWDRMASYGFVQGIDYTPYQMVHPQNKQIIDDYALKLDVGKEISMIQRSMKGKEARQYFIDIEKKWNSPEMVMKRALEYADRKVLEMQLLIDNQKPKVLFAEALETSQTSILIGELAKLIKQNGVNIGPNRLFDWMRENGYLIRKKGESYNLPTQYSMENEWFEIKKRNINNPDGSSIVTRTTKVTGKGQIYFINKFLEKGSTKTK